MIKIAAFAGEIPRLIPRLLQENYAQFAQNTKLEDGALTPIRKGKFTHTMLFDCKTIYHQKEEWLGWEGYVNVKPGPVATDRLYITGDGKPKVRIEGTTYDLAVPYPQYPLIADVIGTPDSLLSSTVLFAYTYLTEFDEESEPSPLSEGVLWSSGLAIDITGFTAPAVGRRIDRFRIYRSQTSTLGETTLYYLADLPATTTSFHYTEELYPMNEVISSMDYNAPPDDLQGLVTLPNGIMAGFVGKKVYFSEPYRPHAWPEKYIMTVDYPVVGLGVFGSSVAVLTTGMPYVMQGSTPDTMVSQRLEVNLPCLSAQSIVDLGYSVAYASTQGLVTVSQNGASVASANLLTMDQWRNMQPESFISGQYAGRYMASYDYLDSNSVTQRGMVIFDMSGAQPFIVRASDYADAMFFELGSGKLFILNNDRHIYEWDAEDEPYSDQYWKSKLYVQTNYSNFAFILVEGEDSSNQEQRRKSDNPTFSVTVIADGKPVATVYHLNVPVPLPSGFLAKTWEIEIRGNQTVTGIVLASSPTQMAEG